MYLLSFQCCVAKDFLCQRPHFLFNSASIVIKVAQSLISLSQLFKTQFFVNSFQTIFQNSAAAATQLTDKIYTSFKTDIQLV